ncbi:MAG: alpha/beta hydrolase [Defluviitaleaceae bacterium]|nr:alpha/beta hydrolase [Defluviitaleaceae bacterium]
MEKCMGFIKSQKCLVIALALIVLGSFMASMFNSSFFSVNVSRISFETEHGTLTGLLYMPRGAGPEDPRPVLVTTHGFLNTGEMQDALAIEMSRRGYIVLALDMYDHGNSRWANDIPVGGHFGTFWIQAQFSAVQYMFRQPFTLRDADGNGIIAVSGHSMGGFSSIVAVFMDEMQSLQTGNRMIHSAISVGADLSHAQAAAPLNQLLGAMGSRNVGVVAGLYDEFFFNAPEATAEAGGTVIRSDWTETPVGRQFLGIDPAYTGPVSGWHIAESGEFMVGEDVVRGSQLGRRVVFTPNEIHPWNHFSATATSNILGFLRVLEPYASTAQREAAGDLLHNQNQIWQWKVAFNFITLIGYFMMVVPVMGLLLKLPFLKLAVTKKHEPVPLGDKGCHKVFYWVVIAVSALLPAYLIPMLMERRVNELAVFRNVLIVLAVLFLAAGVCFYVLHHAKDNCEKCRIWGAGGVIMAALFGVVALMANLSGSIMNLTGFFVAPAVNTIGYWAIMCGVIAAAVLTFIYFLSKKHHGAGPGNYGLKVSADAVAASFVTAFAGIILVYALLFIMQAIFVVDGRVWTLAIRTFTFEHVLALFRYAPFFLVFYFFNAIAVSANTMGRKWGNVIAVVLNVGGIVLWVAIQYIVLFATGTAWYPTMALNAILLFALIPCLAIAAIYARKLYEKTNNVFLAAFTNTIFFTMIVIANTAVFWNMR